MESLVAAGSSSLSWCCWCWSRWPRPCGSCRRPRAGVVERLGRYSRTLDAGLAILVPFVDRLRPLIDLREQVVSFPPQPVITEDNLVVGIDTVIYFQVTDAKAATYEIANYIQGVEQLTVTTLRNVVGNLNLEEALTSRDHINAQLRGVLDEATGKWGIRVNRVEIKAIDPPASIQDSMEKQMRAEREKRADDPAPPRASSSPRSSPPRASGRPRSSRPRATRRPRCCAPRARRRRSRRSSTRSTPATPTRSCWPTSTSRCCRRSPRATPTSSGSSRASSARRSRASAAMLGASGGTTPADDAAAGVDPRVDPTSLRSPTAGADGG